MPGFYFTDFESITDKQYQHCLSLIPEERVKAVTSYRYRKDSLLSLAAYLLLNYALPVDRPPMLYCNQFGKPYLSPQLSQGNAPFFSLSHTHGIATCFLSEQEVGIDVEHTITSGQELVATICSEQEQRIFEQSGFSAEYLTRLWVLKESCLKSVGVGLSVDPRHLDFSQHGDKTTFTGEWFERKFSFHVHSLLPGTFTAVCIQGLPNEIEWTQLDVENLLSLKQKIT